MDEDIISQILSIHPKLKTIGSVREFYRIKTIVISTVHEVWKNWTTYQWGMERHGTAGLAEMEIQVA